MDTSWALCTQEMRKANVLSPGFHSSGLRYLDRGDSLFGVGLGSFGEDGGGLA